MTAEDFYENPPNEISHPVHYGHPRLIPAFIPDSLQLQIDKDRCDSRFRKQ